MSKITKFFLVLAIVSVSLAGVNTFRYFKLKADSENLVLDIANTVPNINLHEVLDGVVGTEIVLEAGFILEDGKLSPVSFNEEELYKYVMIEYTLKCANVEDTLSFLQRANVVATSVVVEGNEIQIRLVNSDYGVK